MRMGQGCPGCHKEIYRCCKDNTDDIRIRYGSVMDINYTWHPQTFYRKFKQFDFSIKGLRTQHIRDGCHKDIRNAMNVFTDEKYEP